MKRAGAEHGVDIKRTHLLEIQATTREFSGGGKSSSAWKAYARQGEDFEIYSIQKPPKARRCEPLVLGFSDEDYV